MDACLLCGLMAWAYWLHRSVFILFRWGLGYGSVLASRCTRRLGTLGWMLVQLFKERLFEVFITMLIRGMSKDCHMLLVNVEAQ